MYRILPCVKDAYILNKVINSVRSTDANTGMAGTLDLYTLFSASKSPDENPYEQTRVLTKFNFDELRALTGSFLNINDPSFKCFLSLGNIYHGQPVPSNFTLKIFPLAKDFSEGRGIDVVSYQDLDSTNWITSSFVNGSANPWSGPGAAVSGSVGTPNVDYYLSASLSGGIDLSLSASVVFNRGDEDMFVDITQIVSATLANIIPDYGFRVSFSDEEETSQKSYFVKRFSSRHVKNPFERPSVNITYDDSFIDNQTDAYAEVTNTFSIYNTYLGQYRNFFSGSLQEITGANCVSFNMMTSRSLTVWTSSYSPPHSKSINHLTCSTIYYSTSFVGSQMSIGGFYVTGAYFVNVTVDPNSDSWKNFVNATDWRGGGKIQDVNFSTEWKSTDGTLLYSSGSGITLKRLVSGISNVFERNFIVNITNLKQNYFQTEQARMRVFIQDYNVEVKYFKLPVDLISSIYQNMFWRLINSYTKEEVIPFNLEQNATKLSSDGLGMYFDIYMKDLPVGQVYEFEFLVREGNRDYYVSNEGFKFKVVQ